MTLNKQANKNDGNTKNYMQGHAPRTAAARWRPRWSLALVPTTKSSGTSRNSFSTHLKCDVELVDQLSGSSAAE